MKLETIKYTKIEPSEALNNYLINAIEPLERFVKSFGNPHDIHIELEKTTRHHKNGPYFRAEANIIIQGKMFRAEGRAEDIYSAIDVLKDDAERQLREHLDKIRAQSLRGGRKAKKMLNYDEASLTAEETDTSKRDRLEGN